jgi:hypothetical protein
VRRADNLATFMCRLSWNLGASTSWNPQGLSRPVMGLLYLLPYVKTFVRHFFFNVYAYNKICLHTMCYPKYSGLVPPFIQQLWLREAPINSRTTMCNESLCQISGSWVNEGSFHTRLFGVVYVTFGDFDDGSEKGTASVHQILCKSWETCYGYPHNDSISLRGPNCESYAGVSMACPVQDRSHINWPRAAVSDMYSDTFSKVTYNAYVANILLPPSGVFPQLTSAMIIKNWIILGGKFVYCLSGCLSLLSL